MTKESINIVTTISSLDDIIGEDKEALQQSAIFNNWGEIYKIDVSPIDETLEWIRNNDYDLNESGTYNFILVKVIDSNQYMPDYSADMYLLKFAPESRLFEIIFETKNHNRPYKSYEDLLKFLKTTRKD